MNYIDNIKSKVGKDKFFIIINNIKYYTGISVLTPQIYTSIVNYCNINYK